MLDENGTLNFVGNVEGRDLVKHMADVAVCDAMVGNVTMKFFEGLATFIFDLWKTRVQTRHPGPDRVLVHARRSEPYSHTFDYEKMGASPLLGVKGMVLITHGSAKRRMIEYALDAGATAGRARIPELIAMRCAVSQDAPPGGVVTRMNAQLPTDLSPEPQPGPLTISHSVIVEMVRVAALEVPGVLKVSRGGPFAWLAGSPVRARVGNGKVAVRVWIVARPGHALGPLAEQVRRRSAQQWSGCLEWTSTR